MALIVLAYIPMIVSVGGRTIVRLVASKGVQAMLKKGARKLTKANFKKTYEFFKGTKKLKTSEKNKVLENLNIKTKKISPKKVKPKEDPNPWKGIRKNETIEQFLTRQAATAKSVKKVDKTILALAAARAGKKIEPALSKETQKIIENIAKARTAKTVKLTETQKVKQLVETAAPIKKTVEKAVVPAAEVAKKGSTTWEKAKTAMKLAGWSLPIIAGGGIFFYSTRDKDKDIKETTDIKVDKGITKAEDITITTAKPDDTIPPVDPADPFFKKRETLADKVQSLDFDKDIEIITKEHPSVIKKTLPKTLPGFVRTQTDTGL